MLRKTVFTLAGLLAAGRRGPTAAASYVPADVAAVLRKRIEWSPLTDEELVALAMA